MNLANILEGPAVLQYKDIVLEFRGGLKPTATTESFEVTTDRHGAIDNRSKECSIKLSGTPTGVWTPEHLGVLFPYGDFPVGQMITRVLDFGTIDLPTDSITITAHGLRLGCPVSLGSFGVLPAGLAEGTVYYAGAPDANHITLHLTAADAIAGTNKVNITDAGTDEHHLVEQEPVTIWSSLGRKIQFHVGALTKMPDLTFSSIETLLGALEFECFRKNNVPWSTADSLYTITKSPLNVAGPDASTIPTKEYTFGWGAIAPWASFQSRGPAKLTFDTQFKDVGSDARGLLSRSLKSVKANFSCQPTGASEAAMLAAIKLQGAGAGRGESLQGSPLNITGSGVFSRLYNAQLQEVPLNFDTENPRAGDLKWTSSRAFSAGVAQPVFKFSTIAIP